MNFDNIPRELKELDRWVCWRWEQRAKKDGTPDDPAKTPINPTTGGRAMSNNPATWGTFQDAVDAASRGYIKDVDVCGIGFMFNGDGLIGVDIDNCRDAKTGTFTDKAKDIISTLDSYTEFSQSGKGIHVICYGRLPDGGRRKDGLEMYSTGRYFIMTGNVLDDAHMSVEERSSELAAVHAKYIDIKKSGRNSKKASFSGNSEPGSVNRCYLTDDEIIDKILSEPDSGKFNALLNGNWKGYYTSQSEADLAICNKFAFYSGGDYATIDRLYRRTGLMRAKWDESRPGGSIASMTINKAIRDCRSFYQPPQKQSKKKKPAEDPGIDTGLDHLVESVEATQDSGDLPAWIYGPYHDTWNAERMVEKFGAGIRYNVAKGWHVWNGKYWEEDKQGRIRRIADDTITGLYEYESKMLDMYGYKEKRYKDFVGWLAKSRNTGRKDNMIREAQSLEGMPLLPNEFDKDLWLINCNNGTIDLRTGKIRPHDQKDLITRIIPVNYDPKASAPQWEKFLIKIFNGNKELIAFLQRAIGYSLTGSIKEQCMFILYGVGRNGKSTFLDTIRSMLGGYTRNANASTFMRTENANMSEIARLQGARFVTTSEPEEGESFSESLIKQATGGEPLTAKYLYKEPFEYVPEFKLWMGTNHKPKIRGSDLGIWRRIRLIPFSVIITPEEMDPDLPNKLLKELPGIFNWAMDGCRAWQRDGLREPKEVLSATADYRGEMDSLQAFLDECVEVKDGGTVRASDLYTVFKNWCKKNGEYELSATKFALKMKERGIQRSRTKVMRTWNGIQLSKFGRKLLFGGFEDSDDAVEQEKLPWEI